MCEGQCEFKVQKTGGLEVPAKILARPPKVSEGVQKRPKLGPEHEIGCAGCVCERQRESKVQKASVVSV